MRIVPIAVALLAATVASAQIQWLNPVSANWNVAGNWVGGNVPDTVAEVAEVSVAGTYAVAFNFSPVGIGGLLLTNPTATVNIDGVRTMIFGGSTYTNNGLLFVNTTANNNTTGVRFDALATTLSGSGLIRLNSGSSTTSAQMTGLDATRIVTQPATHSILGKGRIGVAMVNNGLIRGDISGGLLQFATHPHTNNGTIEATNGAEVEFNGIVVTNTGTITADGTGSLIDFINATVQGGVLSATNSGLGATSGTTVFNNVTLSGSHQSAGVSTLAIGGAGLTNNGALTINSTANPNTTTIRIDSPAISIGGTGSIHLNSPAGGAAAQITPLAGGNVLTLGAGQTVFGIGQITAETINNGLIDASTSGGTLGLRQTTKTNSNIMQATSGGTLSIEFITVNNNGQIRADGTGSTLNFQNAIVVGGTMSALNGGVGTINGAASVFSDLTLSGPFQTAGTSTLALAGAGITNNGTLTVNATANPNTTTLRIDSPATTIGGTGTILLNAGGAVASTRVSTNTGTHAVTIGPDQTLAGRGGILVTTTLQGTLSPGSTPGVADRFELLTFNLTMTRSAVFEADINGLAAGQFDTLSASGGSTVTLDGTIVVRVAAGFTPVNGNEFPVVTANSPIAGTFDAIDALPLAGDAVWRVRYYPNGASLSVSCEGDVNGDHVIDLPDLSIVLANFGTSSGATSNTGDANGDGAVNLTDLSIVLSGFGAPCP